MIVTGMALALVGGCGGDVSYVGYNMWEHFGLDGKRTWVYASEDTSVDHEVRVEKVDPPVTDGAYDVYTLEHFNDSTGDLLMSVEWSADSINGIFLHGYQVHDPGSTGGTDTASQTRGPAEIVDFDPPIQVAEKRMTPGSSVATSTGGWDFVSTLAGSADCPNYWAADTVEPWECLKVTIDDGDGSNDTGAAISGTYWLAPRYGITWVQRTGDAEMWILRDMVWEPTD